MLFLRSWLEEYINLKDVPSSVLAKTLTLKSSEVDEFRVIEDYFGSKVVVGRVLHLKPHPNADRLNIFEVDLGKLYPKKPQIISAAPNIQEGMMVAVALVGARLGALNIQERKMRGHLSQGMCCGKSELFLETPFSEGIWELDLSQKAIQDGVEINDFLGQSICKIYPQLFPQETIFDISVLPNRIGAIGNHLGMSLEVATALKDIGRLTQKAKALLSGADLLPYVSAKLAKHLSSQQTDLKYEFVDNLNYCKSFFLFELNLQKTNSSQASYFLSKNLRKRLFLTGKNMVNDLVDLSNYLLWDVGQPNHLFDKHKLVQQIQLENTWQISKTAKPQKFEGLGQLKSTLLPKEAVTISTNSAEGKDSQIIHLPGISGSNQTKVGSSSKDLVLEVANFDKDQVAKNCFKIRYRSDGAKVWAGQVEPTRILILLARLVDILTCESDDLGLQISIKPILSQVSLPQSSQPSHASSQPSAQDNSKNDLNYINTLFTKILEYQKSHQIEVRYKYLSDKIDSRGTEFWTPKIKDSLPLFGQLISKDGKDFLVPNLFYTHIKDQEDLLDQVCAQFGFEGLPKEAVATTNIAKPTTQFTNIFTLKTEICKFGFTEVINRPFVAKQQLKTSLMAKLSGSVQPSTEDLELANAYRTDKTFLRDSLLASLMTSLSKNLKRGEKNLRIFEFNKIFKLENNLPVEQNCLALAFISKDPYLGTSIANQVLPKINHKKSPQVKIDKLENCFGVGYQYWTDFCKLDLIQINNKLKKIFDLPFSQNLWYAEFDLASLDFDYNHYRDYVDESVYPSIYRSYSIQVRKELAWSKISQILQAQKIQDTQIFIRPLERIPISDSQDKVNYEVEFTSYTQTLDKKQVEYWESEVNKLLLSPNP